MEMIFAIFFALDPVTTYVIGFTTLVVLAVLGVFTYRLYVAKHRDLLIGRSAQVIEWNDKRKRVKIIGEIWNAKPIEPMAHKPGDHVKIVGISSFDLTLQVSDNAHHDSDIHSDNPLPISKG